MHRRKGKVKVCAFLGYDTEPHGAKPKQKAAYPQAGNTSHTHHKVNSKRVRTRAQTITHIAGVRGDLLHAEAHVDDEEEGEERLLHQAALGELCHGRNGKSGGGADTLSLLCPRVNFVMFQTDSEM